MRWVGFRGAALTEGKRQVRDGSVGSIMQQESSNWRQLLLVISAVVVVFGFGYSLLSANRVPTPRARITQIESQVKCPSCEGVSALDATTAAAHAVRSFVAESVAAGKTNTQIFATLENTYGPSILLTPPASSGGTFVAALPFVFIAVMVGLIGFFGYVRRQKLLGAGTDGSDVLLGEDVQFTEPDLAESTGEIGDMPGTGGNPIFREEQERSPVRRATSTTVRPANARGSRRLFGSVWALYLGIMLVLLGIGSGIVIVGDQHRVASQAVSAFVQAQEESQVIQKARVLANQGQDVQALKLLSAVLEQNPTQFVALAYQGWLLSQAGEKDKSAALINQGQQFLAQSVKLDPKYPDARVFLGYVLFRDRHDVSGAVTQFKAFLANNPSPSFIQVAKPVIIQAFQQAGLPVPAQLSK